MPYAAYHDARHAENEAYAQYVVDALGGLGGFYSEIHARENIGNEPDPRQKACEENRAEARRHYDGVRHEPAPHDDRYGV